jgi:hypothetical protein
MTKPSTIDATDPQKAFNIFVSHAQLSGAN